MSTNTERHLNDAELVRALDVPPAPDLAAHLAECRDCAVALESLRDDSALVSRFLVAADFEDGGREARALEIGAPATRAAAASPSRSGLRTASWFLSPWLKAAAILVLVAGPLAAIPSVRAWVVERVAGGAATENDTPFEAPRVIRFTPDPGDFVVKFEPGTTGAIRLLRSSDHQAELRAVGGEPETVVGPSSLEIRNRGDARYWLQLPSTVSGAWIRVGDHAVAVSGSQIDRQAVIDLGRRPTLEDQTEP